MAAIPSLFVFIDELLQFIEFGWLNILKRDPERILSDPLDPPFFDRDRFPSDGND